MDVYKKMVSKATKLVNKLQDDITIGKRKIIENYGQKEISKFIEKELNTSELTYSEQCSVKDILYKVSSIH